MYIATRGRISVPETRPGPCNRLDRNRCRVNACVQSTCASRVQAWPAVLSLRGHRSLSIAAHATSDDEEYEPDIDCMERMEKSLTACEKELIGIRAGRAQPSMLSTINVDYYGAPTPLQSLASVSAPDASTLMIKPFDKSGIKDIEDAIMGSGLGFTPNNDGETIRINVPQLTEERRKEMVKLANSEGENAKVAVRNVRRDVLKKVDKMDLPEDDLKATQEEIQEFTDEYIKKIDEMVGKKNKELTTV